MRCPFCGYTESKVIDSRPIDESERIRRRRECLKCERRFTTYEVVESTPLVVIKRDQSREPFDGNKLLAGMLRACEKRPVPLSVLEEAVRQEVASSRIGELPMEHLRTIDEVAYIRFASVYRQFQDIESFAQALRTLQSRQREQAEVNA